MCSQLTEPGNAGWRGEAPVLNYSPHIHLAVPIIQGSVHERSLPARPSCEKWVMEFKGTHSLLALHSGCAGTALAFLCLPTRSSSYSMCAILSPAVKSTRLFGNVCQLIRSHSLSRSLQEKKSCGTFTKCVCLCLPPL